MSSYETSLWGGWTMKNLILHKNLSASFSHCLSLSGHPVGHILWRKCDCFHPLCLYMNTYENLFLQIVETFQLCSGGFLKFRCFSYHYFIAIVLFCANLGVMETWLVSNWVSRSHVNLRYWQRKTKTCKNLYQNSFFVWHFFSVHCKAT